MPNSATAEAKMVHHRSIASLLGVTDKSISGAIDAGKFTRASKELKQLGRGKVHVYMVAEDDPLLMKLIQDRAEGRALPVGFIPREEQTKAQAAKRAAKKAKADARAAKRLQAAQPPQPVQTTLELAADQSAPQSPASAAASSIVTPQPSATPSPASPQPGNLSSSPIPGSPASGSPTATGGVSKQTYRTSVWLVDERTNAAGYLKNFPGEFTDPEALKRKLGPGTYFIKVEKWKNRFWEMDESKSIWSPMEPLVILSDEDEEQPLASVKPASQPPPVDVERSKDLDFFRGQAQARLADATRPRGDEGMSGALAQMSRSNAEAVASAAGVGQSAVTKALDTTNSSITRLAEMMQQEAATRADQHKRDMDDLRTRAEEDRRRIQAESEARLKEIQVRADLEAKQRETDMDRREAQQKRDWDQQDQRNKEFIASMTKIKDDAAASLREAQDTKLEAVVENVTNKAKELEERFNEKAAHLEEMNSLKASMQPMHLVADTIQKLGEKFGAVAGPLLAASQGLGGMPGTGIGRAPENRMLPNGEGGKLKILDQIKSDAGGREMLADLLKQAAAFARDDDPVDLFANGILSMVNTTPMFAAALAEIYKTPLSDVMRGALEPASEEYKILSSDKGRKFWDALHLFLKETYNAMAAARAQAQAPPAK